MWGNPTLFHRDPAVTSYNTVVTSSAKNQGTTNQDPRSSGVSLSDVLYGYIVWLLSKPMFPLFISRVKTYCQINMKVESRNGNILYYLQELDAAWWCCNLMINDAAHVHRTNQSITAQMKWNYTCCSCLKFRLL